MAMVQQLSRQGRNMGFKRAVCARKTGERIWGNIFRSAS